MGMAEYHAVGIDAQPVHHLADGDEPRSGDRAGREVGLHRPEAEPVRDAHGPGKRDRAEQAPAYARRAPVASAHGLPDAGRWVCAAQARARRAALREREQERVERRLDPLVVVRRRGPGIAMLAGLLDRRLPRAAEDAFDRGNRQAFEARDGEMTVEVVTVGRVDARA